MNETLSIAQILNVMEKSEEIVNLVKGTGMRFSISVESDGRYVMHFYTGKGLNYIFKDSENTYYSDLKALINNIDEETNK